jgi:hypothetical protein
MAVCLRHCDEALSAGRCPAGLHAGVQQIPQELLRGTLEGVDHLEKAPEKKTGAERIHFRRRSLCPFFFIRRLLLVRRSRSWHLVSSSVECASRWGHVEMAACLRHCDEALLGGAVAVLRVFMPTFSKFHKTCYGEPWKALITGRRCRRKKTGAERIHFRRRSLCPCFFYPAPSSRSPLPF